jgi:acetyltransferase-like isoleucine patch superfamily enzyme
VFVSRRVLLKKLSGKVELGRIKTGIVRIGFGDIPLFDCRKARTVLCLSGKLVFNGAAEIGPGCQLGIVGELICGDRFAITGFSLIATKQSITFGNNVMLSWDVSVIDHDWHDICDEKGILLNPPRPVFVGDDVWVCCQALILKGCTIKNGVIVAAGTTVTGSIDASNAIIGADSRLRVLRSNVFWKR